MIEQCKSCGGIYATGDLETFAGTPCECGLRSSDLLAVQTIPAFAVMPPDGWDDDFKPIDSLAWDAEKAWIRFCHPALRREAYEADGFKAVPVTVTIHSANSNIMESEDSDNKENGA